MTTKEIKILSVLLIVLGLIVGGFGGYFFTTKYFDENPEIEVRTEYKTITKREVEKDKNLIDNACILYQNYKTSYLAMDRSCNADPACSGSATQKEAYETYKGWDSFYEEYCR